MSVDESSIKPERIPLISFAGDTTISEGTIKLPVYVENTLQTVRFTIIDKPNIYNAILGTPWINSMKAIPSTYHQCIKIPLPDGVCTIKGNQGSSRACFVTERKTREKEGQPDDHDQKIKGKIQRWKKESRDHARFTRVDDRISRIEPCSCTRLVPTLQEISQDKSRPPTKEETSSAKDLKILTRRQSQGQTRKDKIIIHRRKKQKQDPQKKGKKASLNKRPRHQKLRKIPSNFLKQSLTRIKYIETETKGQSAVGSTSKEKDGRSPASKS
ncbi:hypothetical protein Bca101_058169 [Brassica carinata]